MKPKLIRKSTPGRILATRQFQAPVPDDVKPINVKLRECPAKASNLRFETLVEKSDTEAPATAPAASYAATAGRLLDGRTWEEVPA